jgi:hypothetical protein
MNILLLPPSSSSTYLLLSAPKPVSRKWYYLAPLLALAGGIFGIAGAFFTELSHSSLLSAFFAAPIIEEALKPSGLYLITAKWPRVLQKQILIASLAALGGICSYCVNRNCYPSQVSCFIKKVTDLSSIVLGSQLTVLSPSLFNCCWAWTICCSKTTGLRAL